METLQEYSAIGGGVKVDRTGVIRGCRIIGHESKNGRSYPAATLQAAIGLYENASVNINHDLKNPGGPRDYRDRLGRIRNVTADSGGLRGDFHFNPKHALAEQLIWDAEHAPENVGFSHNVEARTSRKGGKTIVEEIVRVQSVDLVADPATTKGLFEETAAASEPVIETAADFAAAVTGDLTPEQAKRFAEACRGIGDDPAGREQFRETMGLPGRAIAP